MPEERAARVGSHLTRLRAIRTLAGMPARPVRGLRLAPLACVLAVGIPAAAVAAGPIPTPIGVGALYHPAPGAVPVAGLRCASAERPRFGAHVELFAHRQVVIVPAGIGIAPPLRRQGAYVLGGRCSYPLRTREPTGVVEVERGASLTLGQLFEVWGQPLSRTRLVGFVVAFPDPRVRRRAPLAGRPARDPAPPARGDRARARRLRAAARGLPLPEGALGGEGRSRCCGCARPPRRRLRGLLRLRRDHRRRRTNLRADGLPSRCARSPREADGDRLHDHAARRDAAPSTTSAARGPIRAST